MPSSKPPLKLVVTERPTYSVPATAGATSPPPPAAGLNGCSEASVTVTVNPFDDVPLPLTVCVVGAVVVAGADPSGIVEPLNFVPPKSTTVASGSNDGSSAVIVSLPLPPGGVSPPATLIELLRPSTRSVIGAVSPMNPMLALSSTRLVAMPSRTSFPLLPANSDGVNVAVAMSIWKPAK